MKNLGRVGAITLRNLIIIIILFPLIAGIFYMSEFLGLIYIIISFFVYFLIYFIFVGLYTKYIKRDFIILGEIFKNFLYKISITILIIVVVVGGFLVYNNDISPASLPIYKISSDKKEIIFQTMSHIATKKFYREVEQNIINAKSKGYVLFYEGVKIEKKEEKKLSEEEKKKVRILGEYNKNFQRQKKLKEEFNKALGIKFDKDLYKNFSRLYGLVPQNNQQFLGLINNKDYNVDLSLEEVMKIYKQKIKNKKEIKKVIDLTKIEDVNKNIIDLLKNLNKKELRVLVWVNRGIMNFIIKNDDFRKKIMELSGKQDIMGVILDDRNKHLAKEIMNSKHKKIYIIYGMMHFEGVFKELRKVDKTWKIDSKKEVYFIK